MPLPPPRLGTAFANPDPGTVHASAEPLHHRALSRRCVLEDFTAVYLGWRTGGGVSANQRAHTEFNEREPYC